MHSQMKISHLFNIHYIFVNIFINLFHNLFYKKCINLICSQIQNRKQAVEV